MATKHTNSGIYAGDTVIVYLENYSSGRQNRIQMSRAEVERVTPTQVIIEGIRYYADPYNKKCGTPVEEDERHHEGDDYQHSGWRHFAHPQTVKPLDYDHIEAQLERPEALTRAMQINDNAVRVLGSGCLMGLRQILDLSKDPVLMTSLDVMVNRTERARKDILEDGIGYFKRFAPARVIR